MQTHKGRERRAQVRPPSSVPYLNIISHGQNLSSTSGKPEFVAQNSDFLKFQPQAIQYNLLSSEELV
jgi:hypothetical protein